MKSFTLVILSTLARVAFILAFIPVLFPYVIGISVIVSLVILVFFRAEIPARQKWWSLPSKTTAGARVLRRSALAAGVSLGLYTLLWAHSQLFYVGPLKRDQEPFRKDAFEKIQESIQQQPPIEQKKL